MPNTRVMLINEIYGPTFSGEGPTLGTLCGFIRTAGCNLDCGWCDTDYTWNFLKHNRAEEVHRMTVEEVIEAALPVINQVPLMLLSGGEPMLQQSFAASMMDQVAEQQYKAGLPNTVWEIQTNGTIEPQDYMNRLEGRGLVAYCVSPKLRNSGVDLRRLVDYEMWNEHQAIFKFVCSSPEDLDEIEALIEGHNVHPMRIWIMPEGQTREDILNHQQVLTDGVLKRRWNLTTRLHVLLWEKARAV